MSNPFQKGDRFDVVGLGEHVHGADGAQPVAALHQEGQVAGQGGRVAGDGDDLPGFEAGQKGRGLAQTLAGRIKEDGVEAGLLFDEGVQALAHVSCKKAGIGKTGLLGVAAGPENGVRVGLDAGHACPGAP